MAVQINESMARKAIFDAAKAILLINKSIGGDEPCEIFPSIAPLPYPSPPSQPPPNYNAAYARPPASSQSTNIPNVETVYSDEESVRTPDNSSIRLLKNSKSVNRFNGLTGIPLNIGENTESVGSTQSRTTLPENANLESIGESQTASTARNQSISNTRSVGSTQSRTTLPENANLESIGSTTSVPNVDKMTLTQLVEYLQSENGEKLPHDDREAIARLITHKLEESGINNVFANPTEHTGGRRRKAATKKRAGRRRKTTRRN